jgi:excalibur calcium-binding domain-containing protein
MKRSYLGAAVAVPVVIVLAPVGVSVGQAPAATGAATIPYLWQNCTHVHTKYRHGVGKVGAHDRTTGTPVTTFYRSTRLYNIAKSYNVARGYDLDRDHDGIACEKR